MCFYKYEFVLKMHEGHRIEESFTNASRHTQHERK
jgi:hypothetical protein